MHSRGRKASFGVRRPSSTPSPGCCRGWELRHWLEGAPACYKGPPAMRAALQGAALAFPVRCCALVGRFADPRIAESVSTLLPHLASRGVQVLVSEKAMLAASATAVTRVPEREFGERADLVIAIGGDGTLLHAARLVARHAVPLLGVNRGRLGFLTDVMPQNMLQWVDAALAGELEADRRQLLTARLHQADGRQAQAFALNDVVMQKHDTGRTLDFDTRVNGRYVNTHTGDGIIVASATGSTPYAPPCAGPII